MNRVGRVASVLFLVLVTHDCVCVGGGVVSSKTKENRLDYKVKYNNNNKTGSTLTPTLCWS